MSRIARPLFYGLTFVLGAATLTGCAPSEAGGGPAPGAATQAAGDGTTATPGKAQGDGAEATTDGTKAEGDGTKATTGKTTSVVSDVSELKSLGVTFNEGVLIDVADDGLDRYLAVGKGGVVDFTGTRTSAEDAKMMSLVPARVANKSLRNRVVIAPPFYNEGIGDGHCVADTAPGKLRLATCEPAAANQVWEVTPAGDSGQFTLQGVHTSVSVDEGKIITAGQGYEGLQTIPFAN